MEEFVRDSKLAEWLEYRRAARGRLGPQNQRDRVSYYNIEIRELP
jgi:hypothetical protein